MKNIQLIFEKPKIKMSNTDLAIDKGIQSSTIVDDFESCDSSVEMDQAEPMEVEVSNSGWSRADPELKCLQKVDIYVQQLPFFDQIKKCAFETFELIRKNITEAIVLNEFRPGFSHWSNQLIVFIHEYGLFFTKQDHLKLIKLYLSVMLNERVDLPTIDYCLNVLTELLK